MKQTSLRLGFTLVELLLVVAIILALTALALGVMQSAQDDARESATINRISTIESLLQQELENYEVRRLPIRNSELLTFVAANPIAGVPVNIQAKNLRRRILGEIIRQEMPTFVQDPSGAFVRNEDLGLFPSSVHPPITAATTFDDWLTANYPNPVGGVTINTFLASRTTSRITYWAQFNPDINTGGPASLANFLQPGEYLYKILELIDIEGSSGIELVGPNAIGNPDGDEHLDIVDAWGNTMELRVLQVQLDTVITNVSEDIYRDTDFTNWDSLDPTTTLPVGYEVLNPTIPRLPSKIRFQVVSPELNNRNL